MKLTDVWNVFPSMLYWNGDPEGPLPVGLITDSEPVETVQVVCVIFTMAGAGIPG